MSEDIFNEYAKLAIEKNLIKIASKENPKKEKRNSFADDAIRLLYGVEPETIYEEDSIIDAAHPESYSVGRSYDAMNSIVENLRERQDIMAWIALKNPTGRETHKRYVSAKHELINSIVRTAFLLDNKKEYELMTLADSCAIRLEKENVIKKEAYIVPLAIGAASLLLTAYYFLYGETSVQNVLNNTTLALQAIEPLTSKSYTSVIKSELIQLESTANLAYKYKSQLIRLMASNPVKKAVNIAKDEAKQAKISAIVNKIKDYVNTCEKVKTKIPGWIELIKEEHSTDIEQGTSDWWAKIQSMIGKVSYKPEQILADRLAGQGSWQAMFGLGGELYSGGLYAAISSDIEKMKKVVAQASQIKSQVQNVDFEDLTEKPKMNETKPNIPEVKSQISNE